MAAPRIYSKALLKTYILRKLGGSANSIELDDENLNDAIADTLDIFLPRAYSGTILTYVPTTFQAGTQTYKLPYDVFAVMSVNTVSMGGVGAQGSPDANPFHINQLIAADVFKGGKVDLLQYELTFQLLETMNIMFGKKITFDFNTFSKNLLIQDAILNDTKVILEVYKTLTPEEGSITNPAGSGSVTGEITNIYDQVWIRNMAVEQARLQWAINLMKFEGSLLPNGGQLNVSGIRDMAEKNIETLMKELDEVYTLPAEFFIG